MITSCIIFIEEIIHKFTFACSGFQFQRTPEMCVYVGFAFATRSRCALRGTRVVANYNFRNSFVRRFGDAVVCSQSFCQTQAIDVHCWFGDETVYRKLKYSRILYTQTCILTNIFDALILFSIINLGFFFLLVVVHSSIYFHDVRGRCRQIAFAQYFKCSCLLMAFHWIDIRWAPA